MELSKKDKKVARQIIEIGLQKEFAKGLQNADKVLQKWKINNGDNKEFYHELYQTITDFDKHIAGRYDGMAGSKYLYIIAAQFYEGIIDEKDLEEFSEDARMGVMNICKLYLDYSK